MLLMLLISLSLTHSEGAEQKKSVLTWYFEMHFIFPGWQKHLASGFQWFVENIIVQSVMESFYCHYKKKIKRFSYFVNKLIILF